MTRHLNRVWNYFVKGFLGTLLILFVFPLVCISVSLTSIVFAIAAPIWIPCITTLLHIYMMLVYDLDSPNDERNKYCILLEALVWDIFIQGIIQPLIAVIIGSIVCPLISLSVLIGERFYKIIRLIIELTLFLIYSWGISLLASHLLGLDGISSVYQKVRQNTFK